MPPVSTFAVGTGTFTLSADRTAIVYSVHHDVTGSANGEIMFAPVIGLERIFHLEEMEDVGFAMLTGDDRYCPARQLVGAWRRHLP